MNAIRLALNIGSVVLVAVLGWLVVRSVMGVMNPASLRVVDPIVAPNVTSAARVSARRYDFTSDPFSFGESAPVEIELVEDAPETTLNLKLKGIVSESSATFRLADGKDKPVAIGNEVMNGVTLIRTTKTFVILDVNGDEQKLTLERVKLESQAGAPMIGRAPAKADAVSMSPQSQLATRADVENLFSQIELVPQLEIMPDKTLKRQGMKINARSGANLSKFGLKSGDIVTRIGPVMLDSNRTNIKELQTLLATGAAQDIEVLRDGSPVTIRIGQ